MWRKNLVTSCSRVEQESLKGSAVNSYCYSCFSTKNDMTSKSYPLNLVFRRFLEFQVLLTKCDRISQISSNVAAVKIHVAFTARVTIFIKCIRNWVS